MESLELEARTHAYTVTVVVDVYAAGVCVDFQDSNTATATGMMPSATAGMGNVSTVPFMGRAAKNVQTMGAVSVAFIVVVYVGVVGRIL